MTLSKYAKEIDIAEPIWKDRSVGLAVDDVPLGQNVKVTISYRKKGTGELAFPGDFEMNVDKIRTYPQGKVGPGIRVYYVPIKDLTKTTIFNNNQKQSTMLFGSQELGKIIKESEEAKSNGGNFDNKKFIEPGKHLMTVENITLENAKSDGNPMVVVEFKKDDDHRTIKEFMKIAGPNTDIPREKLVRLFHRGFNYSIQPCNTEKDLIDQLIKFKGKTLTVAIKGRKQAYSFEKDGQDIVMETIRPEFWYAGMTSEFDDFYIDMDKSIVELTQEDKEKLVRFAEINGGPYVPKEKTEPKQVATQGDAGRSINPLPATPAPDTNSVGNAAKIQNVEAMPVTEEQGSAPLDWEKEAPVMDASPASQVMESPQVSEAPQESSKPVDDDFPF